MSNETTQPDHQVGDTVNGHTLGEDNQWHPAAAEPTKSNTKWYVAGGAAFAAVALVVGIVAAGSGDASGTTASNAPDTSNHITEVEDNAWKVGIRLGAEKELESISAEDTALMCEGYEYMEATSAEAIADLLAPHVSEFGLDAELAALPESITPHDAFVVVGEIVVDICEF